MSIASMIPGLASKIAQHSPTILTALGAAGVIGTAVLTGKAFVNADRAIVQEETERWEQLDATGEEFSEEDFKLTPKEKVKLTWKYFIPPLLAATGTIVCVISAQSINSRRGAAMLSLYTMTERARVEFQDKAREVLEDDEFEKIQEEIAKDRIEGRAIPAGFDPGDYQAEQPHELDTSGVTLCYDVYSDRYFVSSQAEIDDAVNQINAEMVNHQNYADLNMFYGLIGLSDVPYGEKVGWTSYQLLGVRYTYVPSKSGAACMAVSFKSEPTPSFLRFHS